MNEAMAAHHYYLRQALIYAIAVSARYFKLRGQALPRIAGA